MKYTSNSQTGGYVYSKKKKKRVRCRQYYLLGALVSSSRMKQINSSL